MMKGTARKTSLTFAQLSLPSHLVQFAFESVGEVRYN